MSSSSDSASRIREQINNTLLQRAQQREREAKEELGRAYDELKSVQFAHKISAVEADKQLEQLRLTLDTLIEFILLNHGEIPEKLVEIIAGRQEQRIAASLPVQIKEAENAASLSNLVGTSVLGRAVTGAGEIMQSVGSEVRWVSPLDAQSIKEEILKELMKTSDA